MKVLLNALAAIPQGTAANPMTSKVSSPPFGMSSPATMRMVVALPGPDGGGRLVAADPGSC